MESSHLFSSLTTSQGGLPPRVSCERLQMLSASPAISNLDRILPSRPGTMVGGNAQRPQICPRELLPLPRYLQDLGFTSLPQVQSSFQSPGSPNPSLRRLVHPKFVHLDRSLRRYALMRIFMLLEHLVRSTVFRYRAQRRIKEVKSGEKDGTKGVEGQRQASATAFTTQKRAGVSPDGNPRLRRTVPLPLHHPSSIIRINTIIKPSSHPRLQPTRPHHTAEAHPDIGTPLTRRLVRALQQLRRPANHERLIDRACGLITLPNHPSTISFLLSSRVDQGHQCLWYVEEGADGRGQGTVLPPSGTRGPKWRVVLTSRMRTSELACLLV